MKYKATKVVKKYERMKGERVNWDEYWEDLAEYFIPRKDNVYGYKLEGERKHFRLYDSTSIVSLELLASSLQGMLTNPSSVWFDMETGDPELDKRKDVRSWTQACVRIMIDTLNQSNFQEEIHETYLDLAGIGTTVLAIEEDDIFDIRFRSSPIYGSYVDENERGIIDTLSKCYQMTWRQILRKFGDEPFEDDYECMDRAKNKPEHKEDIVFLIEPEIDNKKTNSTKFKAYYVLRSKNILLKEATYQSWPYAVPRWTKLNEEKYGRCPAMKALADVKMLNAVMRTTIRGMQKTVDPPLMVPDNGFLLPINTTPGGTNFYRTGMRDRIEPFPNTARPDVGLDFIENIRARIREHFFVDQLQLINQRDMTATEVMQRTDERLRFLGPIIGRMNNELLKPIVDRVFDILMRRGKFPPMPAVLRDVKDLQIVYTSQIAKAQRTGEANVLNKVLQAAAPIIQSQPDTMDNFNGDNVIKHFAKLYGLPEEMLSSSEEVEGQRKARAEQQKQMMEAQQENMNADTAQKQAKAQQG
jgi:hypothetical protein